MRIPIEWLKTFVDFDFPTSKLAEVVSSSITEVEQIISFSKSDVRIGEVKSLKVIKEAKKLSQAKVDVGDRTISVIFSNNLLTAKTGDKMPVAVAPTNVGKIEVKEREFFSIKSQGMFVGNSELGLNPSEDGIIYFKKNAKTGTNVYQHLGFSDVLELKVTPNRGDILSLNGFAKDLAAIMNRKFTSTIIPRLNIDNKYLIHDLEIDVQATGVVPRFSTIKLSGIKNINSPDWMQKRLVEIGIRPINAVVDITNYVMIELGQPLHAFDFEKISEVGTDRGHSRGTRKLFIRRSKSNETLITLDAKKHILPEGAVVIADQKKVLDVAGIMGGLESGVSPNTHEIVLVSSIIDSTLIRKTSKALKLSTDASYRYERRVDPEITVSALKRATELILEICGGRITSQIFDIQKNFKTPKSKINFSIERFWRVSGSRMSMATIINILRRLEFHISNKAKTSLELQPPSWRHDISFEEDIYEELLRIDGYNNLNQTLPTGAFSSPFENKEVQLEQKIAQALKNLQFNEVLNFSFYSPAEAKESGISLDDHIKLLNPLGQDTSLLRASLIPCVLKALAKNANTEGLVSLFEIGHIFEKQPADRWQEIPEIAAIISQKDQNQIVRLAKLAIEQIAHIINAKIDYKDKSQSEISLVINKETVGSFQVLNQNLLKFDKRKRSAVAFRLNLKKLLKYQNPTKLYQAFNIYPSIIRDITLNLKPEGMIGPIINKIIGSQPLLSQVELKDIYQGKDNKKSVTLRLIYQSPERTLNDKEVNEIHQNVISKLEGLSL